MIYRELWGYDKKVISFSIADNVSCSREETYDREKCVESLKTAGLWEKMESLKEQEQTYLNKDIKTERMGKMKIKKM